MGVPLCVGLTIAFASACEGPASLPAAPSATAQAAATTGATCPGNGAHGKHVQDLGLDCSVCHPSGAQYGFTTTYTYPRGTTTAGGTIVPSTATTPASCSVGCHSPLGAPAHVVEWTTPGPLACTACHDTATLPLAHPAVSPSATRAECLGCHDVATHTSGTVTVGGHDASWMDPASSGFHALAAERGLSACQACHGQDLTGGWTGVSCGTCHDRTDATHPIISWKTDCVMCHGGTDNATGAPPKAIWSHRDEPARVGAHTSHVSASAIAPAVPCSECHTTPADVFAPGHIDELTDPSAVPAATVEFGGLATLGGAAPSWDAASVTCASTYCHGATLDGGTNTAPSWTVVDGSQAACGTCHGLPPGGPHPGVDTSAGLVACNPCHAGTVDASGAVIPPPSGGEHLDGLVEAAGHPASWMDRASGGFHAYTANLGLASCQDCHGQDLAGGWTGVACASCHGPGGQAAGSDFSTCSGCHGGTDNATGAPPRATWGHSADAVRVGAHTRHVTDALARAFDCGVCHVKPADVLSAGHVDAATAKVTFGGVSVTGGVVPSWDRATATCASTYCHGNFPGGDATYAPTWTAPVAAACGTCHGLPPEGTHSNTTNCAGCHDGYTATTVNAALHVNGSVDVMGLTCASCHGDPTRPPTTLNPRLAAAPPIDTYNNSDPAAPGVGAHQAHLSPAASNAVACTECHVVPTSTTHANGVDDVTFGPLASGSGSLSPAWDPAALTCASTYCHGNFTRGNAANAPIWNGNDQAACGTCHPARPAAYLHNRHSRDYTFAGIPWWPVPGEPGWVTCDQCHFGVASSVDNFTTPSLTIGNGTGPALHVDGKPDVVFKHGGSYGVYDVNLGGECSSMACHPGAVKYWPR